MKCKVCGKSPVDDELVRIVGALSNDAAKRLPAATEPPARPLTDYHENHGAVIWWKFPINEPAWIGQPTDSDWPGYHTHWTPHPAAPKETK